MELKDDEFKALRSKVEKVSAELEKKDAARAVNTKWLVTVAAIIVAALGYTNFVQLPLEAAKAAKEQVGKDVVKEAKDARDKAVKYADDAADIVKDMGEWAEYLVPIGTIIAWHPGEESTDGKRIRAPHGWAICDGENGTPDLRGRFLRGLSSDVSVADFLKNPAKRAGQAEHDHGAHEHNLTWQKTPRAPIAGNGTSWNPKTTKVAVKKASHLPPYVNVVYIMKLGEPKGAGNPNRT